MLWTDLFYMIVITTFTGSVLTVAWLITSYLLDKTGYLNMSYRLGKVVVLFWIIPVMYYAIRMIDRLRFVWNGYVFVPRVSGRDMEFYAFSATVKWSIQS